ncbi:protein MAIN-LIKE 1 [Typha angustifolia]|uniref:protein MAIN-LIKE 1 n=1 Tax=Typha angustifolia TaxID=59011 RepID=UPI003C2CEE37
MEDYLNPGPVDNSVLIDQARHRSSALDSKKYIKPIRFVEHGRKLNAWDMEHSGVLALLRRAGFYYLSRLKRVHLDHALLNALLERWRRETQTFHLRHGEITILLKDVAILSGLVIDGVPVTGRTDYQWEELCMELLGQVPDRVKGGCIKIDWLYQQFHVISTGAGQDQTEYTARAYIMYQIGCSLFPDPSGNRVHLKYLALLRDFDACGQMAWGAAVLAYLYRELGKASLIGKAECCGFLTLLQMWAWEHLHVGRPQRLQHVDGEADLHDKPLGCRWNAPLRWRENAKTSDIEFYRNELDIQMECQVTWDPYSFDLLAKLPASCKIGSEVWRSRTPLISYEIVEMHVPDRVLRQFGMIQHVPEPVEIVDRLTRQGRSEEDWSMYHEQYIRRWADRLSYVVSEQESLDLDPVHALENYMQWYWSITRRWICTPVARPAVSYQPQGHVERVLVNLVVDIQAQIKEVLASGAVSQSVAETFCQIEGRISTVLDEFKLLHVSASLPGLQRDDICVATSLQHHDRQEQTPDHARCSSSSAHLIDEQVTLATKGLGDLLPPTLTSVVVDSTPTTHGPSLTELASFTPTSTLHVSLPPILVATEPISSTSALTTVESAPLISVPVSKDVTTPLLAPTIEETVPVISAHTITKKTPSTPSRTEALSAITALIQASEALARAAKALTWQDVADSEAHVTATGMEDNHNIITPDSSPLQLDQMPATMSGHTDALDIDTNKKTGLLRASEEVQSIIGSQAEELHGDAAATINGSEIEMANHELHHEAGHMRKKRKKRINL